MTPPRPLSRTASLLTLVGAVALCFAVAAVGGTATADGVRGWYPTLDKPPWTPPSWVFGPVWTVLYLSMAVAIWDVVRRWGFRAARLPLAVFGLQLGLNLLWSPLFFAWHLLGWALVEIVALWLAIAACVAVFWRYSKLASLLMVPYLAWVSLATALNAWIWQANP